MGELSLLDARYDAAGDVLYLGGTGEAATRAIEDASGIVWRYGRDGALIGATVLDFREAWGHRTGDLAATLAARFRMPVREIAALLDRGKG